MKKLATKTQSIVCKTCGTRHEVEVKMVGFLCNGCSRFSWKHYDY